MADLPVLGFLWQMPIKLNDTSLNTGLITGSQALMSCSRTLIIIIWSETCRSSPLEVFLWYSGSASSVPTTQRSRSWCCADDGSTVPRPVSWDLLYIFETVL